MDNEKGFDEINDEHDVVRGHNRVLRRVVSLLRKRVRHGDERADEIFLALCDTNPAAEQAMGELWGSGEFDCGPQDYSYMIERSIEAVRKLNKIEGHTNSQPVTAE
jgi:hypothetical protein